MHTLKIMSPKTTALQHLAGLGLLSIVALSACQPAPALPAAASPESTSPAPASTAAAPTEIPQEPTAAEAPALPLSEQPYTSPSGAFAVFLPAGWNCSESGQLRVDCQPPDGSANISLRAAATGYELAQPAFEALANAAMVSAYRDKKVFSETARQMDEGLLRISADWREGSAPWQSQDIFTRSGAAAYQLSFSADAQKWAEFAPLFDAVAAKTDYRPQSLSGAPIYSQTVAYTAPDVLFTLDVPADWAKYADIGSIENTQLEGFLSPDLHAAVQVVVYRQGSLIKVDTKAFKTLEIMRKLYGYDLRVSHDKALPDGRERLAWTAAKRRVSGISYFDSFGSSMYIFSVVWDDDFERMYQPVLDLVVDSFGYE